MENTQVISKTKLKKFHLQYCGKEIQNIKTKESLSAIQSEFKIENIKSQDREEAHNLTPKQRFSIWSWFCIETS